MAISLRNPIRAKIDDRASFINHLLKEYPVFLDTWEKEEEKKFAEDAKECAGDDKEIESSIYSQNLHAFDDDENRKDMFYQAILLMSFSFYDSSVTLLRSKGTNARERIEAICKSKNIILSPEAKAEVNYLQEDFNTLRNNICHNNMGTYRKAEMLNNIASKWDGVHYSDDTIRITDSAIIEDALDKMHHVLSELCDKLGYKTRLI